MKEAPDTCPYCNSDYISYVDDLEYNSITVRCGECGKKWIEVYTFSHIDLLDKTD